MDIVDMRGYSDKRVISAALQRQVKNLPKFSVKFWDTNDRLYLTTFNGGSKVEITVSANDRDWLARSCASDRLYIASIAAFDRETQTISIIVLCYNEEKSLNLKCGTNEEFIKQLKRSVMLPNPNTPHASLNEMAAAALSGTVSVYVLGTKLSAAEAEDPDYLIVCSENDGYITLVEREEIGAVCCGISASLPDIEEKYRFYIVYGELEFLPEEKLREEVQGSVASELRSDVKSYLNLWQKVGEHEIKSALVDFSFGAVKCSFSQGSEMELCFKANQVGRALQLFEEINAASGTTLWVWKEDPSEIIANIKKVIENGSVREIKEIDRQLKLKANERITVVISEKYVQEGFRVNGILPINNSIKRFDGECYLTYDPSGSYVMFRRRAIANENIISCKNPMPCLVRILEERYSGHFPSKALPEIPVMDDRSGSDFFKKHRLNDTQYEAVRIALNTPDIAVIQGPPGTGKTTVIAAIVHRLNELSGNNDNIFGRNLVSAFQHVAVDNALDRMDIFGIPIIKIGEKNDRNSDRRVINVNIENWMYEQQERVLSKNPSVKRFSCDKRFNMAYSAYLCSSNSIEAAVTVLREAYDLLRDMGELASETGKEVSTLLEKLSSMHSDLSADGNELLLDILCRLPTNAEAYFDGGKRVINEAIALLNTHSEPVRNYSETLEAFLRQPDEEKNFSEMKALRAKIISVLKPKPDIFTAPHDNCLVQKTLTDVSELIHKRRANNEDPEEFALGDYFDSLCSDYGFVKETIISYSAICGATNQHSSSEKMLELKDNASFDNVIIDEAARSNPLDLMIPMSLAKERIILVGDHRQLPHIIDSEVARLVEDEVKDTEGIEKNLDIENELKESLFERLKNILTDIERRDHIKRCITLDMQYRTHPVLGDFVSRVFYEYHDKSEAFESPTPASEFSHSLPGIENKAAVWMDVPMNKGEEERCESSFIRSCEARAIVKHIKRMMDSDAGKALTFGVITFYAAQVEEIKNAMRDEGMADKHSKEFLLKDQYARCKIQTQDGQESQIVERLRIGSVDAFQGMEFDVVYLSVVRCNRKNNFGFLKMENRLCVAMSRQKRLLIAAGARSMFGTNTSKTDVRQICEFLKLCESGDKYCAVI